VRLSAEQQVCKLFRSVQRTYIQQGRLQASAALLHLLLESRQHLCQILLLLLAPRLLLVPAALPLPRRLLRLAARLPLLLLLGAAAGLRCCCRCCSGRCCRPLLLLDRPTKHPQVHSREVACSKSGQQTQRHAPERQQGQAGTAT